MEKHLKNKTPGICRGHYFEMVGARRFELPTSWSRTRRANQTALRPGSSANYSIVSGPRQIPEARTSWFFKARPIPVSSGICATIISASLFSITLSARKSSLAYSSVSLNMIFTAGEYSGSDVPIHAYFLFFVSLLYELSVRIRGILGV